MNALKSLVLAALLSVQVNAMAGTPSSSMPDKPIGADLFADGSYSSPLITHAGNTTFTDKYTFELTAGLLQEYNSLSTTLNYTNSQSVGCALLIFCGSSTRGFSDLSLTLSPVSATTNTSTASNGPNTSSNTFITPILFWSSTQSTDYTISTDYISLLSTGNYTLSVAGTTLSNGGSYSLGVTAVPEPQTGAMVVLGLGVLALIARRRNA